MAELGGDIRIIGLDALQKDLRNLTGPPLATILTDASDHAKKVAKEGVGGVASRSLMSEVKPNSARVFSLMAEARTTSIELGRAPDGPLLHTDALRRWASRVGFSDSLFELARQIQRRGVKGRFFMKAAIQSTQNELPRLVREMAMNVKGRFGNR